MSSFSVRLRLLERMESPNYRYSHGGCISATRCQDILTDTRGNLVVNLASDRRCLFLDTLILNGVDEIGSVSCQMAREDDLSRGRLEMS